MIKIQIPDREVFRKEFWSDFHPLVVERLGLLKMALSHLNDPANIPVDEIVRVKTITKAIVELSVKPKQENGAFNKGRYQTTLQNYLKNAKEVLEIDYAKLINLINYLLVLKNGSLENLLVGEPLGLKATQDYLFDYFDISSETEKEVMSLAFSYDVIGSKVRKFFYKKDISIYCAYCNIAKARHRDNTKTGAAIDQYHLDHFFNQADHPMLGLSLFNLVPSDYVCNSVNKLKKPFSDIFHLNPHVSGFKRDAVFEPVFNEMGEQLIGVDLSIKVARDSEKWKQFIGDEDERDLAPDHGNINVFQLHGKYNDNELLWQVKILYNSYINEARNNRSLQDILDLIENDENDRYKNIKHWYETLARTHFHENKFGNLPFSKLYRDLLDHAFGIYSESLGKEIVDILQDSYLPEKGGE